MSEKVTLEPQYRDVPYEQDHLNHIEKGVNFFRLSIEDISEEKMLQELADDERKTLQEIKNEYMTLAETDRIQLLFNFRKSTIQGFLVDFFTRGFSKQADGQVSIRYREVMAQELDLYLDGIESEYFWDYSDITEIKIQNTILEIHRGPNNKRQIDLAHAPIHDHDPRRVELQQRTKEAADGLKDKISTETYMAGAVTVKYETVFSVATAQVLYHITKIMVRNDQWKMEEVKLPESETGTKESLEKWLLWTLRGAGYLFDTATQAFISTTRQAIEHSIRMVELSTFEKYVEASGVADTAENRQKFEQVRTEMLGNARKMLEPGYTPEVRAEMLEKASQKFSKVMIWVGTLANISMEAVFWGVFFSEYHKNAQDLAGIGAGVAELGLFKLGSRAGRWMPAPPILKPFIPMVGWMFFAGLGHIGASETGMNKTFWRVFPDREDYWEKNGGKEGNSLMGNILTGGFVNALYDAKQTDLRVGKREWTDMYIPFGNGKMWTLGSLDIGRSTVDMNTPPWEYMGEWKGRDRNAWNAQVEKYREWLTVQILSLFHQYSEGKNVFEKGNVLARSTEKDYEETKKEILRERLIRLFPHFDPDWFDHNGTIINNIIRQAVEYVTIEPESRRSQLMNFFIEQQIDLSMTLSNRNLKAYKVQVEQEGWVLAEMTDRFAREFSDPVIRQYIHEIFGHREDGQSEIPSRIMKKQRLVNASESEIGEKEQQMFRSLIGSQFEIKDPILKEMYGGGKPLLVGDLFYRFLNQKVELKRMKESVTNVAQTGKAQKWRSGEMDSSL